MIVFAATYINQTSKEGTQMTNLVKQGNDLLMMSESLKLLTDMTETLVGRHEYKPMNTNALSQVITGITQVANGLTLLLADHAKVVEMEKIVNNLSPDQD